MKGFEVSGTKGTYLELEDGRMLDTVTLEWAGRDHRGMAITGECAARVLRMWRKEVTDFMESPLCSSWSRAEAEQYVGAN